MGYCMDDNAVFTLGKIPKNGHIDKYLEESSMILKQKDSERLKCFIEKLFRDYMSYLGSFKKCKNTRNVNVMLGFFTSLLQIERHQSY